MKKVLKISTFFLFLTILLSCKKEEIPQYKYFVKFKIDGRWIEFTDQQRLNAAIGQSGNVHTLVVTGFTETTNASISFFDKKTIDVGAYDDFGFVDGSTFGTVISYQNANGETYSVNGANPEVTARVTLLSSTETKGQFYAVLKHTSLSKTITVTNGEFYVKRINYNLRLPCEDGRLWRGQDPLQASTRPKRHLHPFV